MTEAELLTELEDPADLEATLARVHVAGHAMPRVHLRVHRLELGLRWRQGRYGAALWQLVALTFAVPVSLVLRWNGRSRV